MQWPEMKFPPINLWTAPRIMKKELRYFQQDCVKAIIDSLKRGHRPYANCVTGFGKSLVLADLSAKALKQGKRVLQLVPNHTLCEQNYRQSIDYFESMAYKVGMCSAKAKRYELSKSCVIATQTSLVRRVGRLGHIDLCLIDEADMVALDDDTTYRKIIASLLAKNPAMKIVGVTGSPYRQDQGEIHQGENALFTECCYESDIPRLINEGYLSSVEMLNSPVHVDLDGVKIVRGEYDQGQVGVKFDAIIDDAVADFKRLFQENNIQTALIFASTIDNGQKIVQAYNNPDECRLAHGGLNNHERKQLIEWLTNGSGNRFLVNVGLYTRGFDYPALECLVLLRATKSLRLYVQIIGRLLRTHDEKPFGYLIDYGTNVERFGPIDSLKPPPPPGKGEAPIKYCLMPMCGAENRLSAKECKECGAVFVSENDDGDYSMKSKGEILKEKEMAKWVEIVDPMLAFEMAYSRKDGTPMVKMKIHDKYRLVHEHYICIEHSGYAGANAVKFLMQLFKDRQDFYTLSAENELTAENINLLLNSHYDDYFFRIKRIVIAPGKDKYKEIKGIEYEN